MNELYLTAKAQICRQKNSYSLSLSLSLFQTIYFAEKARDQNLGKQIVGYEKSEKKKKSSIFLFLFLASEDCMNKKIN